MKGAILTTLTLILILTTPCFANEPIKVGVSEFAPFVMKTEDGTSQGYSIDIWKALGKVDPHLTSFEFKYFEPIGEISGFKRKLAAVKAQEINVGIGGITVNAKREEVLNFGNPTYNSRIAIAVNAEVKTEALIALIAKRLFSKDIGAIFAGIGSLVMGLAFLLWLFDRKDPHNKIPRKPFDKDLHKSGIEIAIIVTWEWMTTIGSGVYAPGTRKGYAVVNASYLIWVFVFSIFVATVTSAFDTKDNQILQSTISSPQDLLGKVIATKNGTDSVNVAKNLGVSKVLTYPTIKEAYAAQENGKATAVIYDLPGLKHYEQNEGKGKILILPQILKPHHYAYAYHENNNKLKEQINCALEKVRGSGELQRIHEKWFGENN